MSIVAYVQEALERREMKANLDKLPNYAIIIRCIHERGASQEAALTELNARGLWLNDEQKQQAGLI